MSKTQATRYTPYPRRSVYFSPESNKHCSNAQPNPLQFGDGPLVWIDLEVRYFFDLFKEYVNLATQTSGLDPEKNRIMEIAVLITHRNLDLVDEAECRFIVKSNEATIAELVFDDILPYCLPLIS
jgi:hypothetical protein